ncbi:hypothetical protein [Brachyspira catarrhinii]|uniref:Uncharacterized protein n=1 Tax=Brachyspira catarrhinii TaxID=2528966 RepID=A0ABY2TRQ9_9SPIR|nr:hypothetical protein [Brachyspira catarrhinii]TKZ35500.1 hypothetical protein EZH24_04915 [Brachyspira catarrhinii]
MKKLLTILSFILLLLICLVVMFCSNEKVTGVGGDTDGYDGWDAPPNTIIQGGSYIYTLNGDKWELTINASDRTVSVSSNNVDIPLQDNKYDNVFNGDTITIKTIDGRDIIFNPSNTNSITIDGKNANKNESSKPDPTEPDPDTSIGKDYKYYFVLETHASEVSGGSDYRKQVDYTNSRLFLNKNDSLEIQLNEKTKLKVNNINTDKGDLKDLTWDAKTKILTIKSSVNTFVYNFTDKTVMIDTVKGYLVDEINVKYNVERPSGWYIYTKDKTLSEKLGAYVYYADILALYYDCNPTNQSVYLAVISNDYKGYEPYGGSDYSRIASIVMKVQDEYYSTDEKPYYPYRPYYSYIDKEKKYYSFGSPDTFNFNGNVYYYKTSGRVPISRLNDYIIIKGNSLILTDTYGTESSKKEGVWTNKEYTKTLVSGYHYTNRLKLSIKNIIDTDKDKKGGTNTIPPHIMEDFTGDKIN